MQTDGRDNRSKGENSLAGKEVEDNMEISVNKKNEDNGRLGKQVDEEEVISPIKLGDKSKEEGDPMGVGTSEMKSDSGYLTEKENGMITTMGQSPTEGIKKERTPKVRTFKPKPAEPLLITMGQESERMTGEITSVSGVKRVLFAGSPKKRNEEVGEPYIVELPEEEEKGELLAIVTVNQQANERILIEELGRISLKRSMEDDWKLPEVKRVKDQMKLVEKTGGKKAKGREKEKGKAKKRNEKEKRNLRMEKLVEVPMQESKSGSRFDLLASIPEDYVFSTKERSGGRLSMTTQAP